MSSRTLGEHQKSLESIYNSLVSETKVLIRQVERRARTLQEYKKLQQQIEEAEKLGKREFDSDRFLIKLGKRPNGKKEK